MALPPQFLDDIRARVPLSGIVAKRVTLTRRGHEHSGLCPFHAEKTPSFTVNDSKGFYHCFGCQEHGSIFDFVMKTEGLEFIQAVEQLAREAGVDMPAMDRSARQSPEQKKERDSLYDLMDAAAMWFQDQLREPLGANASKYLDGRGLSNSTVSHFRIGFAPDSRTALKTALQALGFTDTALIASGMVIAPDDGAETYDRFRNRIMFPIKDTRDRIIAFGGRALAADARAKYLNSPETPLFHKGSVLFNLSGARGETRSSGSVTVVEGYMDVAALHQAGFLNTVAPLGTALTERQMAELWRLVPEPVLCMDGDAAGAKAAQSAAKRALGDLKPGHSLRFAVLPEGEDPDSLVQGTDGVAQMQTILDAAAPLAEVLWAGASAGDFSTPERQAGLRKQVFELAGQVRDATVRDYYKNFFTSKLDAAFGATSSQSRRQRPGRRSVPWANKKLSPSMGLGGEGADARRIRVLLATVVNHPEILDRVFEDLCSLQISDPELDKLSNEIIDIAGRGGPLDFDQLNTHLDSQGLSRAVQGLIGPNAGLAESFAKADASPIDAEAGWREMFDRHGVATRKAEVDAAAKALGKNMTETEFARFAALKAEADRDADDDPGLVIGSHN
ncbi:MAG: DNA primase [Alphaproteobacteria bacterium]|nr:DNA primase [Alphaproteobacteria bacterium]